MDASNIFTPNADKHGEARYVLYRHAGQKFSITPDGEQFGGTVSRAPCGLGCYCGAYITAYSKRGAALLAKAVRIDNMSNPIA